MFCASCIKSLGQGICDVESLPPNEMSNSKIKNSEWNCAKKCDSFDWIAINFNKRGKTAEQCIQVAHSVGVLSSRFISICDVRVMCTVSVCVCSTCSQLVLRWRFLTVVYSTFMCVCVCVCWTVAKKSIFR